MFTADAHFPLNTAPLWAKVVLASPRHATLSSSLQSWQAVVRKAGLWRHEWGFSYSRVPWENTPKGFMVKSSDLGMLKATCNSCFVLILLATDKHA